ncbi:MAG TPA: sigma-70 family RNA polymerase sigma factor [Bacteroidia bacterium]|nr:sigma-70 family RNA polymerase sigma factor [Bacteroidia bacterium]
MERIEEIIIACKKNDSRAQEILFNRYAKTLLGICCRYVKDRDDAEDILQETFIKIFHNISSLKQIESAEGWMKRIAVNSSIAFLKEKQKIKFESADKLYIAEENTEEEEIDKDIKTEQILACLNLLPDGYRAVFNLYLVDGLSHKEIAEKLGIQEASSRSQYFKARKLLIELITKKEETNKKQWKAVSIMMSLLSASWQMWMLSLSN